MNTAPFNQPSHVRYTHMQNKCFFALLSCLYLHANHVLCIADVVKWSRAMDIRLTDWCCSASMLLVQILLRENEQTVTPKI
jgi:hypothetical protein